MKCSRRPAVRWLQWQQRAGAPVLDGLKLARFVLDLPRPLLRAADRRALRGDAGRMARWKRRGALAGLDPALPAAKLLGLRPLAALWRQGRLCARPKLLDEAVTATRQFAKRQMTWFRNRMADYVWFEPVY